MNTSQPAAKRKLQEEPNPLLAAAANKKAKKDGKSGSSNKRKLLGAEETPGGLLIVRAPESRISSSQPSNSQPSRPSTSQHFASTSLGVAGPSKQPSKKFRAESQPPSTSTAGHQRNGTYLRAATEDRFLPVQDDADIERDVRAMEDEADNLRRNSRVMTTIDSSLLSANSAFSFPAAHVESGTKPKKGRMKITDVSIPIPDDDTPKIERNRRLREGAMAAIRNGRPHETNANGSSSGQGHRRKSSLSRGKRISSSFASTGVITQPHNSVSDTSFYKHIDSELPEAERIRLLLTWCSLRAQSSKSATSLPPLTNSAAQLLRHAQNDVIRMLAEKKIDLSMHGPHESTGGEILKENEQNVRNRNWEVTYSDHIRKLQEEEEAWKKVSYKYDAYGKRMQASLNDAQTPSVKSKGKRRATGEVIGGDEDLDRLHMASYEPPLDLVQGVTLAKTLLHIEEKGEDRVIGVSSRQRTGIYAHLSSAELEGEIKRRLPDVQYKIDMLRTYANTARSVTNIFESALNRRFEVLSLGLAARRDISTPVPAHPETQVLGTYVSRAPPGLHVEPVDLLRALARVDTARPPANVGDAARRAAREVQRVEESGGVPAAGERGFTEVKVPLTPKKMPGTPRRGNTPGRER